MSASEDTDALDRAKISLNLAAGAQKGAKGVLWKVSNRKGRRGTDREVSELRAYADTYRQAANMLDQAAKDIKIVAKRR